MDVIVYGIGKFAEYAAYLISNDSKYQVCAFCIEQKCIGNKEKIGDLPVLSFEDIEKTCPANKYKLFIAVGLNKVRGRIFDIAKSKGYKMISYISSKAQTWDDLVVGENSWVGEGTSIQPFVKIGDDSIIFGGKIGHHVKIGNHTLLSSTTIGGDAEICDFSMLGMNSVIKQNVIIGKNNIIGMGCIMERDTTENEIYHCGKSTKKRHLSTDKFEDKYLR